MALQTILLALTVLCAAAQTPPCRILGRAAKPSFYQHGDFIIGGVFGLHNPSEINRRFDSKPEPLKCSREGHTAGDPQACFVLATWGLGGIFTIHSYVITTEHNYTSRPEAPYCTGSLDFREVRFARTMVFAIKEINNSSELLPGVTLGYQIHDSCSSVLVAVRLAFQLANGIELIFFPNQSCSKSATVHAIVGESSSTPSIAISRILGRFGIPLAARAEGICVEYSEAFYRTNPREKVQRVAEVIRRSTARVIMAFVETGDMLVLLSELEDKVLALLQWIGNESWIAG
ncbi:hypothetical protein SKAU_G00428040 [Synaphobranchus kaupii]|uniref:Receptor ligand binding region domain-containing protein n=1 Tax=Synaphobranchus kaupii TaxID=118154 RepID=A0A9Q1E4Q2_SYNKA|nr:hypothetical protein SKAU_G00428040 [Synaphobranchus kaupii]